MSLSIQGHASIMCVWVVHVVPCGCEMVSLWNCVASTYTPVMSTPALSSPIVQSFIVHPCEILPCCLLLQCPLLQFQPPHQKGLTEIAGVDIAECGNIYDFKTFRGFSPAWDFEQLYSPWEVAYNNTEQYKQTQDKTDRTEKRRHATCTIWRKW